MASKADNPFDQMTFTYDRCFLCGSILTETSYTEEHIIPKWLQRKFDLWNKELILLNQTSIKYKDLKIPCCQKCNNIMNREIENPMKKAVEQGYKEFIHIDERIVFQWLNKLSYGFLYKELSLKEQLSNRNSEFIYKVELLKEHRMQYLFLKSLISNTTFINNPWSIMIFKIDVDGGETYWAYDNPFTKTFCIRMDDIGIITHLMDNGYTKGFFLAQKEMRELLDKTLHPIQFAELCAKFIYKSSLFYREPFYTIVFDNEHNPNTIVSHYLSGDGYREWIQKDYAHTLAFFWNKWEYSFDDIYKGDDLSMSFLRNEDGTFKNIFK